MNEDKSARYHRLGRRTALLSTVWTFAILCGLMLTGGSVALRAQAADVANGAHALVALYVLELSIMVDIATLPFVFYRGFLLERRYGLATETIGHWLKDYLKTVVIGLL